MINIIDSNQETPRLYTPDEVKDIFKIGRSTVDSWSNQGILTKIKIGKRCVRFDADEVDNLIKVRKWQG